MQREYGLRIQMQILCSMGSPSFTNHPSPESALPEGEERMLASIQDHKIGLQEGGCWEAETMLVSRYFDRQTRVQDKASVGVVFVFLLLIISL